MDTCDSSAAFSHVPKGPWANSPSPPSSGLAPASERGACFTSSALVFSRNEISQPVFQPISRRAVAEEGSNTFLQDLACILLSAPGIPRPASESDLLADPAENSARGKMRFSFHLDEGAVSAPRAVLEHEPKGGAGNGHPRTGTLHLNSVRPQLNS